MNAVKNNPYRTLGLFGNSSEKELQKQIATIKRFAEVGKTKVFDYDFPFFGEVVRSTEKVQEAASKIEQAKNKVHYALFWFLNSGHIDEAALNNLKEGHIEKATEIWEKTLKDSTVTVKNFAAISNLSTLQLGIVTYNGSFDPEKFAASIELKGKLIMSDACDSFIKTVIGEGISINRETILKEFADEVMQIIKPYLLKPAEKTGLIDGVMDNGIGLYRWENGDLYFGEWKDGKRTGFGTYLWGSGHSFTGHFNLGELHGEGVYLYPNGVKNIGEWASGKYQVNQNYNTDEIQRKIKDRFVELKKQSGIPFNSITIVQFINSFRSFPNEIKQYVKSKFTEKPISSIEAKIETCKENRDINPSDAAKFGEELFSKTKSDLTLLKNVSGEGDVQFQMINNKVAQEILQCSIDYFNELQESNSIDPGDRSLKLLKLAKSLKPTGQAKSRIEENEESIQEWVNDKPEREKSKKIKDDLEIVASKLQRFQNLSDTISNAKDLVVTCKPKLNNIKAALGSTDDFYLKLSSAVVNNALNALISEVNNEQNALQWDRTKIITLPTTINSAMEVMNMMSTMDMVYELKSRFNQNKSTISGIQTQLNQITSRAASYSSSRSSSSSSGGCYIATMAYGSYEHPQVMELRKFRDNTLSKSSFGRGFIKTYYKYSPKLVEHLKDKPLVNQTIKSMLNTIIRIIK